jgi:hypothetical protein
MSVRLVVGAVLRLSILAAIVWLALHDRPGTVAALIALFILTPLDQKPPRPAVPQSQATTP